MKAKEFDQAFDEGHDSIDEQEDVGEIKGTLKIILSRLPG